MWGWFERGWRRGVVGGDGCLSAGVCGVLGVAVVVGWAEVQNNDRKRKTAISKSRSPNESHIIPLYNGFGLTTHGLTDIAHLGTFMV